MTESEIKGIKVNKPKFQVGDSVSSYFADASKVVDIRYNPLVGWKYIVMDESDGITRWIDEASLRKGVKAKRKPSIRRMKR